MKLLLVMSALLCTVPAVCQDRTSQDAIAEVAEAQDSSSAVPQSQTQDSAQSKNPSVLDVKPGTEALKEKDFYNESGYLHPFRRMPRFVAKDQESIWTSPFRSKKSDIKWWVIFGAATGALIATDKNFSKYTSNNSTLNTVGNDVSWLGHPYTLLPLTAGFYFVGTARGSDHFREMGLLSFETLASTSLLEVAMKSITGRQRPAEGQGKGEFEATSGSRWTSSFPSGHAISTFALASIIDHEYPHRLWLKFLVYGYAAGVMGARLAANKHFPGDVMAGAALGWFIGDYTYAKRHNPEVDGEHRSWLQRAVGHVQINGLAN